MSKEKMSMSKFMAIIAAVSLVSLLGGLYGWEKWDSYKKKELEDRISKGLDYDCKKEAKLLIKQLRTTAKQLDREPSLFMAKADLNEFIRVARLRVKIIDGSGVYSRYRSFFEDMARSLEIYREVCGANASVQSYIEEFENTADELEVELELMNKDSK